VHRYAYEGRRLSAKHSPRDVHGLGISLVSQDCGRSNPTQTRPSSGSFFCVTKKKVRSAGSTSMYTEEDIS
jgi:hypothetical protein